MRNFWAFTGAFFLSYMVAGMAAVGLAEHFKAREEFILVLMALTPFNFISLIVFAIAYGRAKTPRTFDRAAIGLGIGVVASIVALVALAAVADGKLSFGAQDFAITAEWFVPAVLTIAVQWWLLRRRWRRAHPQQ